MLLSLFFLYLPVFLAALVDDGQFLGVVLLLTLEKGIFQCDNLAAHVDGFLVLPQPGERFHFIGKQFVGIVFTLRVPFLPVYPLGGSDVMQRLPVVSRPYPVMGEQHHTVGRLHIVGREALLIALAGLLLMAQILIDFHALGIDKRLVHIYGTRWRLIHHLLVPAVGFQYVGNQCGGLLVIAYGTQRSHGFTQRIEKVVAP